ncbi:hypothetical protein CEXT_696821 [Caerostris extrusa]|uniref:Uncharacterized protein n=1 Tax=Caerostris extrusa TaxID=172846 RepID=A0AAV4T243_CAEEX|nr:hypothetical protein CEXT_696821 [Caerostris extrusa]
MTIKWRDKNRNANIKSHITTNVAQVQVGVESYSISIKDYVGIVKRLTKTLLFAIYGHETDGYSDTSITSRCLLIFVFSFSKLEITDWVIKLSRPKQSRARFFSNLLG